MGLVLLDVPDRPRVRVPHHAGRVASARIVVISIAGLVAPFALGYRHRALVLRAARPSGPPSLIGFRLFFAVAMSITAIPILGRIFMELGLSHTRTAALTIGAAAIDDVAGWLLLGVVSLIVRRRVLGELGGHARRRRWSLYLALSSSWCARW